MGKIWAATYNPPDDAASWAKSFLYGSLMVAILATISGLLQFKLLSPAVGEDIPLAAAVANDARQRLIGLLQYVVFVGTVVTFFRWFYRAHRNLPSLGNSDLNYSPAWTVVGFIVPFLNLVRPFQVMCETWHGSNPSRLPLDLENSEHRNRLAPPATVGWWWLFFVVSGMIGNVVIRMVLSQPITIEQLQGITVVTLVTDALEIPAALLALIVVSRITAWQMRRHEQVLLLTTGATSVVS